jgi:hypothetical protein
MQEGLWMVFGPIAFWWLVIFLVLVFLAALFILFLTFYRRLQT